MAALVSDTHSALAERSFGFTVAVLDLAVARVLRRIPRDQVPDLPDRVIAAPRTF